jgi:hypothetical protein
MQSMQRGEWEARAGVGLAATARGDPQTLCQEGWTGVGEGLGLGLEGWQGCCTPHAQGLTLILWAPGVQGHLVG